MWPECHERIDSEHWPSLRCSVQCPSLLASSTRSEEGWVFRWVRERPGVFARPLLSPFSNQATLLGLAWGHRLPIGQKCSDSAVFVTVSVCPQEILKENLRMFELVQKHPSHWPPFVPPAKPEVTTTGAGKQFFRDSVASRPSCSNCFMKQKQLSGLIKDWCFCILILWWIDTYRFQRLIKAENKLSAKVPCKI